MANLDNLPPTQSDLLVAQDLTRHYQVSRGFMKGHATVKALNGVSFDLQAGRTLAVVGESGCGKSTLARALTLIEQPTAGSLVIGGQDVAQADAARRKELRREVQMVFQNPYASLNPRRKIGDQLAEPLQINTSATESIGPLDYYQFRFGPTGVGNPFKVAVPELDAIVERALAEPDRAKQEAIWQEMIRYIEDHALDCNFYLWKTAWAYDKNKLDGVPTTVMRPSALRYDEVGLKN